MRLYHVAIAFSLILGCGTPHNTANSGRASGGADQPRGQTYPPNTTMPAPLTVEILTVGDMARALGINSGYILLASNACDRQLECLRQGNQPYASQPQCEEGILEVWCPPGKCKDRFVGELDTNDCFQYIRGLSCHDLDAVIECPTLQANDQVFRVTDWPRGAMPEYSIEDPYGRIMRRANGTNRDPT